MKGATGRRWGDTAICTVAASSFASDFLVPLGLLVAGAAVTGLIVPYITRGWQRHQKRLELKVDLLREVSEAVTRIITHAQWRDMGAKTALSSEDRAEFDWRYGEWEVGTQVVQAQLEAYFPDSPEIERHWSGYCDLLRALHKLSWLHENRRQLLDDLRERYESESLWRLQVRGSGIGPFQRTRSFTENPAGNIDWYAFEKTDDRDDYMDGPFQVLKHGMEAPRRPLADAILYSRMKAF
jgi:hypothetical protein